MATRIRAMLDDAEAFIHGSASEAVGFVFLEGDRPIQPDLAAPERHRRHA